MKKILILSLLIRAYPWAASASDGQFEISSVNIPITITNPGSYVVTEDIEASNGELIAPGATWKYLDNGSNQGTAWITNGFDDSAWASGSALLGYGYRSVTTTNSYGSAGSKYITTYYRGSFYVTNKSRFVHLDLFVRRDDGIAVYLNGNEVMRDNLPAAAAFNTPASSTVQDGGQIAGDARDIYYEFFVSPTNLVNGPNVMAVEVHQVSAGSADLLFDLGLNAYTNGSGNPTNAITIAAEGVSVNLRGHLLRGSELSSRNGIEVLPGIQSAIIQNGSLAHWGDSGVNAAGSTNCVIRNIRSFDNYRDGIAAGIAATVSDCSAAGNGMTARSFERGDGIVLGTGSLITRSITYGNYNHGIVAASSCDISDSIGARNAHDGLHGGQGEVVSRFIIGHSPLATDGKNGEGLEVELGSVVFDCTATGNDDGMKTREDANTSGRSVFYRCSSIGNTNDGIKAVHGSLFTYCTAYRNGDDGITMTSNSVAMYNMAARNGLTASGTAGGGINMENSGNFAAFNHTFGNEYGVASTVPGAVNNLIAGNSGARNTLSNFQVQAGNQFATPNADGKTLRPWANFRLGN